MKVAKIKRLEKHLHIVCLNVPYPVDYGGVFDLFYKLPSLQQQGVKIHLHCFEYGRGEQPELNKYCETVHYYPRKNAFASLSFSSPYIVKSRSSEELLKRLGNDDYPIFMEGVHCTYLLGDKRFKQRRCFVRVHNVEYIYYRQLFENTSSLAKKIYFLLESKLLRQYEKKIAGKATFWSVTEQDAAIYRSFGADNQYLPLFLPDWKVSASEGKGSFCLYHGDLSVAENEKAAVWLFENVFNDLPIPFVIAGKNPSQSLLKLVHKRNTICVIANPDEKDMQDLIAKAHINILPSFNATGIKLKLINALFNGRHCITNSATADGTGLAELCHVAGDANEFKSLIYQLFEKPFSAEEIDARRLLLDGMFSNKSNARQMIKWIWEDTLE